MRLVPLLLLASAFGAGAVVADAAQRYGAVPLVPDGLMPRYFLDKSNPILKRDGTCGEGNHPCRDIGHSDQCCSNDKYCYIDNNDDPRCCAIGSNCPDDSKCSSDSYFCSQTVTPTTASATVLDACCNRQCPGTSSYLCAKDVGGHCCHYGWECRSGGQCVTTEAPSKTALLTPIQEGCTTSQFKCDDDLGCCDNGKVCTQLSGQGYCAQGTPTGTGITVVENNGGGGLSDGAKAGIAVGVVLGVGLIVGAAAWICFSKRRRRRQTVTQQSASGDGEQQQQAATTDDPAMTEITASSQPPRGRGLTNDYFGPDAVPGPYTETVASSPDPRRAVPSQAQAPGDIVAPVEIDSNGPLTPSSVGYYETPASETIDGIFELHGTHMNQQPEASDSLLPSPQSPRGEDHRPNRS